LKNHNWIKSVDYVIVVFALSKNDGPGKFSWVAIWVLTLILRIFPFMETWSDVGNPRRNFRGTISTIKIWLTPSYGSFRSPWIFNDQLKRVGFLIWKPFHIYMIRWPIFVVRPRLWAYLSL